MKARKKVEPPESIWEPSIVVGGGYLQRRLCPEARSIERHLRRSGQYEGNQTGLWQELLRLWYARFPRERLARLGDTPGPKRAVGMGLVLVTERGIHPAHEQSGRRSLTSFASIAQRHHRHTEGLSSGPRFRERFLGLDDEGEVVDHLEQRIGAVIESAQRWRVSLEDWLREFPDSTPEDLAELRTDQVRRK
ncbi:MAG: hypothetical protein AAGB51_13985 [Planctomycetota bacterium]